jgi:hypothetical protein
MNQELAKISVKGLVKPGCMYTFLAEKENGWDPGPIDQLYVITREEEIVPALEMELCLILGECYELRKFIKWSQILEDCYEFRFRCWDKAANEEIGYSLFLYRLSSFSEKLAWVMESIMST